MYFHKVVAVDAVKHVRSWGGFQAGVQVSALHYSSSLCCLLVPFPVHGSLVNSQTQGCGNKPLIYGSSDPPQEEGVTLKTFVRFPTLGGVEDRGVLFCF